VLVVYRSFPDSWPKKKLKKKDMERSASGV
jgi:hypothetical protein